jgi:dihydrofolate reductase
LAELIYAISASLDGYIADENDNFDFTQPSDDAHAFFNELQRSVGTSLYGRRMYETMRVWDSFVLDDLTGVTRDFAEAWNDTDKSSTRRPSTPCPSRGPGWSARSTPRPFRP